MNTSFATSKNDYVDLQIRATGSDSLHIQGSGPETNRGYGVAVQLTAPPALIDWINGLKATRKSLAGTSAKYVNAQAAVRNGRVHFQVSGPSLNRSYGASFTDGNGDLMVFIGRVQEQAKKEAAAKIVVPVKKYDITLG